MNIELWGIVLYFFSSQLFTHDVLVLFFLIPLIIELPLYIIILINVFHSGMRHTFKQRNPRPHFPLITCVVSAYNEGPAIHRLLLSLYEQRYVGPMEIFIILDDPNPQNPIRQTVLTFIKNHPNTPQRHMTLIDKKRSGHASNFNLGLQMAKGEYLLLLDGDNSCDNDVLSVFSEHFGDKNVVGLSGTLRVGNINTSIITRLQAIEYAIGIGLSRAGLSALNTLNNISGAFGLYRREFLLKIGGWKNGSAEDLDLVLRIQARFRDHPELRLLHDSRAIVHTDVPTTWMSLFKQRFRWEGDLFFIYCRRHWHTFRPKFLGWRLFLLLAWYGLLLQMVVPITLLLYLSYFIFMGQLITLSFILMIGYLYYFLITSLLFFCYIVLISERKSSDARLIPLILFMPIYQFILRIWAAIALLFEICFKTHLDSSMAPYPITRHADKD